MAGPWFTVEKSGDTWHELGQVWVSNGTDDCRGRIEIRLEWEEDSDVI